MTKTPQEPSNPMEPVTVVNVLKFGMNVSLSHGALSDMLFRHNPELERRHTVELIPPSNIAWNRYHAAVAALKVLEAYEGTEWGGPDYGTEVHEPQPTRKVTYTETVEEWRARCMAAGLPDGISYERR